MAMGPRTRRRLTAAAASAAVLAAIAIVVVTLGSGGAKKSGDRYIGPTDARYDANNTKVVFGMTKAQVEKLVGPPTRVNGQCWEYRVDKFISFRGNSSTWNADRLCFYEGKYSEKHSESNGVWDYQPKITFTQ